MADKDVKNLIFKLKTSEVYTNLQNYYASSSFFNIIKKERSETTHSNMLKWILDPNSNHNLGYYPLQMFLILIHKAKQEDYNTDSILDDNIERCLLTGNYTIFNAQIIREKNTGKNISETSRSKYGLVDLVIELDISFAGVRKILPIVLENKVGSSENKYKTADGEFYQTEFYHSWAEKYYSDKGKAFDPIFIYLQVKQEKITLAKDKAYINVFYQELEDIVLCPCLNKRITDEGKYLLNNYIRCLSYSDTIDDEEKEKKRFVMGFSEIEKKYLKEFFDTNRDLLISMATCLHDDDDYSEDDKKIMENFSAFIKNNQKYIFNGNEYGKGRLVQAVVKKYIEDNPSTDIGKLQAIFPAKCVKPANYEVVKLYKDLTDEEKGLTPSGKKRFFQKEEDIIEINNTEIAEEDRKVVVCSEWGKDNIEKFIDTAINNAHFEITKK